MIRDDTDLQVLGYARESLEFFGTHCLVVKPKDGGIPVPFRLNRAQAYIHAKLEEQKAKLDAMGNKGGVTEETKRAIREALGIM